MDALLVVHSTTCISVVLIPWLLETTTEWVVFQGRSVFGSGLGRLGNVSAYDTHVGWGCWQRSCWVHATQDLEPNSLNWLGPHFTTLLIPKTVPTISPWVLRIHSNLSKHKLPKSVTCFYLLNHLACPWLWTFFYQLVGFIHGRWEVSWRQVSVYPCSLFSLLPVNVNCRYFWTKL